jgi:hypothetical protein
MGRMRISVVDGLNFVEIDSPSGDLGLDESIIARLDGIPANLLVEEAMRRVANYPENRLTLGAPSDAEAATVRLQLHV